MKNILIISSSPRKKGNSQILCEQFKKGAEAKGQEHKHKGKLELKKQKWKRNGVEKDGEEGVPLGGWTNPR